MRNKKEDLANIIYIDKEILPELIYMNNNSFKTCDSCAGHLYNDSVNIDFLSYITFIPIKSQIELINQLIINEQFIKKYEIGDDVGFIYEKTIDNVNLQIEFRKFDYCYINTISIGLEISNKNITEKYWGSVKQKYYNWFFKRLIK